MSVPQETFNLASIHPDAFTHPDDQKSLQSFKAIPGVQHLVKLAFSETVERAFHVINSRNCLLLGPNQYPSIYKMVEKGAAEFGIPCPDVYLSTTNEINASAFGYRRYTVTLNSALIDLLPDKGIHVVVAHELGHILCEHMLYRSVADVLIGSGQRSLTSLLGPNLGLVTPAIQLALLQWSRAAEYSADRAALLIIKDADTVASTLARLAGTSSRFAHEFNLQAILEQAQRLEKSSGLFEKSVDAYAQMFSTHPDAVRRVKSVLEWSESSQFQRILDGKFQRRTKIGRDRQVALEGIQSCKLCKAPLGNLPECPECGLATADDRQVACKNEHFNHIDWKFCRTCGTSLQPVLEA